MNSVEFSYTINKLRSFFLSKGFIECHVQNRLSILAACEDPSTLNTFDYLHLTWPLPQTGQMWLEHELMNNQTYEGYFTVTTSYRDEKNPVEGRHEKIFPMFEFEFKGGFDKLIEIETELLKYFGYSEPKQIRYLDACKKYQVDVLENIHEEMLCSDFGESVLLTDFPEFTSPFWNMCRSEDGTAKKIDVIISGIETIGSAERSRNPVDMKERFSTISGGEYADLLYNKFGKDRVLNELEDFLKLDMIKRSGGGIGVSRLVKSLRKNNFLFK